MTTISQVNQLHHTELSNWRVLRSDNPTDVALPYLNIRLKSLTGSTQIFVKSTGTAPSVEGIEQAVSTGPEGVGLGEQQVVVPVVGSRDLVAFSLWWHAWSGLNRNSSTEPKTFDWAREITLGLLENLLDAPSERINVLFNALRLISNPEDILDIALNEYHRTCRERYLTIAVSLLEERGNRAWPALRRLAQANHPESELFVGLIANCAGVPTKDRIEALLDLSRHPDRSVRFQLLENLGPFDVQQKREILASLSNDEDDEIRREAAEYLRFLEEESA